MWAIDKADVAIFVAMGFDNEYPGRKDWRRQYQKRAQKVDRSCRCHGDCPHCQGNRKHKNRRRNNEEDAD